MNTETIQLEDIKNADDYNTLETALTYAEVHIDEPDAQTRHETNLLDMACAPAWACAARLVTNGVMFFKSVVDVELWDSQL